MEGEWLCIPGIWKVNDFRFKVLFHLMKLVGNQLAKCAGLVFHGCPFQYCGIF